MVTGHRTSIFSLAAAALVVAAVSVAVDRLGMAPWGLTGNSLSLRKYESLREHVRREGPNDVVFVGSSLTYHGVIPREVAAALERDAPGRRPARAFNFGIWGHGALTYPVLAGLALGADRPRVVAIEVGHRSIESMPGRGQRAAQRVLASAYGRTFTDSFPPRGLLRRWMMDHWSLWSCGPVLRARLLGKKVPAKPRGTIDSERGYRVDPTQTIDAETLRVRSGQLWETSPAQLEAIERAVGSAKAAGARVLLYDVLVREATLALLPNPEEPLPALRRVVDELGARLDVEVSHLPEPIAPDAQFVDLDHVGPEAAAAYSRWLGSELARHYPDLLEPSATLSASRVTPP